MTMTLSAVCWFAAGALAGAGHAVGLWRTATRSGASGSGGVVRLGAMGVVLFAAVSAGELLATAGGWACGLATAGAFLYARAST